MHINRYVCVKRLAKLSVGSSLGSLSVPFNFQTQEENKK